MNMITKRVIASKLVADSIFADEVVPSLYTAQ